MEINTLDHLGLVSLAFDELEIGKVIDESIKQDMSQRKVSVGQCVKAMVLNGLGFVNQQMYLLPHFFTNKPIRRLFGEEILAEHFNDDTLGRALDSLFEAGLTPLFSKISTHAMKKLEIQNSFAHLDSTSFHVHGQYRGEDENEQVVSITHGYSRDHRPDLKQVGLSLICSQIGRIPVLMKPLSGNSSDSRAFREIIQEFGEHLRDVDGVETFVADCALFSEEAVLLMEEQKVRFVTRMPATNLLVKRFVEECSKSFAEETGSTERYAFHERKTTIGGVMTRMIAVRSDDFEERTITTVKKRIGKGLESEYKSFLQLSRQDFACQEDAQKSLEKFQKSLKFLSIEEPVITSRAVYLKPGKPRKNQAADKYLWNIEGQASSSLQSVQKEVNKSGWFVLVTNQLDGQQWPAERLLSCYKKQSVVEQGFRFLKSPEFLSHSLYLKNPHRIESLLFVMTTCLLVYSALEHRIRDCLKDEEVFFPNQLGKPVKNPTARWVFHSFTGIHEVLFEKNTRITGVKPHQSRLLTLLGTQYAQLYSEFT